MTYAEKCKLYDWMRDGLTNPDVPDHIRNTLEFEMKKMLWVEEQSHGRFGPMPSVNIDLEARRVFGGKHGA